MNCPIHNTPMVLLFTSAVCDLCDPPGGGAETKPATGRSFYIIGYAYGSGQKPSFDRKVPGRLWTSEEVARSSMGEGGRLFRVAAPVEKLTEYPDSWLARVVFTETPTVEDIT